MNAICSKARQAWAVGDVDWVGDTITLFAIDTNAQSPAIDPETVQFLSEVDAAARISSVNLAGKTALDGVLDANDPTLPGVTGDQFEVLLFVQNTGVDETSRVLIYIDTASSGLPLVPNGGDVRVIVNDDGIATL